jgi:hypothetical protein
MDQQGVGAYGMIGEETASASASAAAAAAAAAAAQGWLPAALGLGGCYALLPEEQVAQPAAASMQLPACSYLGTRMADAS